MKEGEVGYYKPEFTEEELKALEGEEATQAPEKAEEKPPEEQEPEKKPDEKPPEEKPETELAAKKDGDPAAPEQKEEEEEKPDPVQKRIDKLTYEKNEEKRKRQLLLELGQDKYFELYPEETPQNYRKPEPKPTQPTFRPVPFEQIGNLVVQPVQGIPQEYHGLTLNELHTLNPALAINLQNAYVAEVNNQIARQRADQTEKQKRAAIDYEVNNFAASRAVDIYDKDEAYLTEEERESVKGIINKVVKYMGDNKLGNLTMEQAYIKMVRAEKKQKETEAQKTLEHSSQKVPGSIGTKPAAGADTGYTAYMAMSGAQVEAELDKMGPRETVEWLAKAPPEFKKKYPDLY